RRSSCPTGMVSFRLSLFIPSIPSNPAGSKHKRQRASVFTDRCPYVVRATRPMSHFRRYPGACVSWMAVVLAMAAPGGAPAYAADGCAKAICAEQGWARATPEGVRTAAIYFSIVNQDDTPDTLVKVSTAVAGSAMLHRSTRSGNLTQMD